MSSAKITINLALISITILLLWSHLVKDNQKSENINFVTVDIADRLFRIPRVYVDDDGNEKYVKDGVVLEYVLPGFEPEPPHPQERKKRQELLMQGRMKGMLLEAEHDRPLTISQSIDSYMKYFKWNKESNSIYGLEKYVHDYPKDTKYPPAIQDDIL